MLQLVIWVLWIFITFKFYNTRFQQKTFLPSYNMEAKSNLQHPLKKTTATIPPSWQHTCPALTAPMAAFMQGVSHLIRENFSCTSGISFQDFRPGSWHCLSTKSITSRSSCPLNEVWLSPHYFTNMKWETREFPHIGHMTKSCQNSLKLVVIFVKMASYGSKLG